MTLRTMPILLALCVVTPAGAQVPVRSTATAPYLNFEDPNISPLALTQNGQWLCVANAADHRLEVYLCPSLVFAGSIFTGLGPTSVLIDPTDPNRVFVANYLSDSVAVVDLPSRQVTAIIDVGDEPSHLAIANGKLFVACSRAYQGPPLPSDQGPRIFDEHAVAIFDATPPFAFRQNLDITVLNGHKPRNVVAVGNDVYVMPQNSGNHTTILSIEEAAHVVDPANPSVHLLTQYATSYAVGGTPVFNDPLLLNPMNVPNANLALQPVAPNVDSHSFGWNDPWVGRILTDQERSTVLGISPPELLPDQDISRIDSLGEAVTGSIAGIMTTQLAMARRPGTSTLWIVGQDARNRTRFEPNLSGAAIDNVVVAVDVSASTPTPVRMTLAADAQPVAIAFYNSGSTERVFVACLGTSRVLMFDPASLPNPTITAIPVDMPIGLAVDNANARLYVMSRRDTSASLSFRGPTVTAFDIAAGNAPLGGPRALSYDPEPPAIVEGRVHLYDARGDHGNGTMSCASCHISGDLDQLAWDLGNPLGGQEYFYPGLLDQELVLTRDTQVLTETGLHGAGAITFANHPMKGPMVTQSLRGLAGGEPFHWRGDRRFFQMFRGAFSGLLGATSNPATLGSPLSAANMQEFATFVRSIAFPPNPYQDRNRIYTGAALLGQSIYGIGGPGEEYTSANPFLRCVQCHEADFVTQFSGEQQTANFDALPQFFNTPQLRGIYEKNFKSVTGFGANHEGSAASVRAFLDTKFFDPDPAASPPDGFDALNDDDPLERDQVAAFLNAWDTGVHPLVGAQLFVDSTTSSALVTNTLNFWEAEAQAGRIDLIAKGFIVGGNPIVPDPHGAWFTTPPGSATFGYQFDVTGGFVTRAQIIGWTQLVPTVARFRFLCVPAGQGARLGVDQDEDGIFDFDELTGGTLPWSPDSDQDGYDDLLEVSLGSQPGNAGSLPADSTAPVIVSAVMEDVFNTTATLAVVTDEPATLEVKVTGVATVFTTTEKVRRHHVILSGLPAGTALTFKVGAIDSAGNLSTSTIGSFSTAVPHFHVKSITASVTTFANGDKEVIAAVEVVDQDDNPVPDGVEVHMTFHGLDLAGPPFFARETVASTAGGLGMAMVSSGVYTPATPANPVDACVFNVGSWTSTDPWFVGTGNGLPTFPSFFYAQADSVTRHLLILNP